MRILVASDSFKDALPAEAVCRAVADGLRTGCPDAEVRELPLADGGEGTAVLLTRYAGGAWLSEDVRDPLDRPIRAGWGWDAGQKTAFIDLASASGLERLAAGERDPLQTSTFGTGQLLRAALDTGAERILLGLGGSSTHDLGLGMAAALGYRFLDADGREVMPLGKSLQQIHRLDDSGRHPALDRVRLEVLCDVTNPLLGPAGAAHTFAAQKGADPDAMALLEQGSHRIARLLSDRSGLNLAEMPGSGAAGGAGAGALALLGGTLRSGVEVVLERAGADAHLAWCDWAISGEGRLDATSLQGKVIAGLLARTRSMGKPLLVCCGRLALPPARWVDAGITAAWSISPGAETMEQALAGTRKNLCVTAAAIGRLLHFQSKKIM